jgi:hypothetical protein
MSKAFCGVFGKAIRHMPIETVLIRAQDKPGRRTSPELKGQLGELEIHLVHTHMVVSRESELRLRLFRASEALSIT